MEQADNVEVAVATEAPVSDRPEWLPEKFKSPEDMASSYSELESKGIPKHIVDAYIQGQQSLADNVKSDIFNTVGGEENYQQMTEWAADNMNQAEKDAFNLAVNSGDLAQAKLAVEALNARYKNTVGVEPNLIGGRPSESMDVYQSWAQVTTDMKNPAYAKDPAFRANVEKKLGRSKSIM